ncbi:hypothetical protein C0Q70_11779 [Pomacea canaliculata]|uniref:Uncharacterized protein n=1 Tax=Pomacea canaliculata TaxID=400727 RepID=A0A2T7P6Y0_POMCA|nr:hypothetical protein C0Q70_11779 [Pomacea canaliculata]
MQQACCEGCRLGKEGVLAPLWAAETKVSNACYSTGTCGHHYLSCGPDETIHLVALSYGFKPSSTFTSQGCQALLTNCDANVSTAACCQYDNNNDCLRSYSKDNQDKFHQKCDGQGDCTLPAAYSYGGCDAMDASGLNHASSFSLIQYKCERMYTEMSTSQTSTETRPLESLSTKESQEGSSVSSAPLVTPCDTCTTHSHEQTQETGQKTGKYDVLQLAIGVSVGAGLGVVALIIIACVCWIRIRRKPLPLNAITMRQADSRSVSDRTSTTRTLGSHRPSSAWSLPYSALETDTDIIQSSHPDSVYSVPTDMLSSVSSFNYSAFLNNVGIGGGHVSSPRETVPNVVNGVLLLPAGDGIIVNEILSMAQKSHGMVPTQEVPYQQENKNKQCCFHLVSDDRDLASRA